jgi:hypothetical protein
MKLKLSRFSFTSLLTSIYLLVISEVGFAQSFSGGFPASRVVQLTWAAPSLSSSYLTQYVRPGFNGWNGISSKVSLSQVVSSASHQVDVLTSSISSGPGVIGEFFPYCLVGGSLVKCLSTDVWAYAQIYGYTDQISYFKLTDSEIIGSVYAHEMGHALSMKHTSPPTGTVSIMKSGFINSYLPQAFDKANLTQRWGN